jgi:hypothetical protein
MMPDATPADKGFHHLALLYRSSQEYLATLLSFARAGLALAEPVFIAVPAPAGDLLRERRVPAAARRRAQRLRRAGNRGAADVDHAVKVKQGDVVGLAERARAAARSQPGRPDRPMSCVRPPCTRR